MLYSYVHVCVCCVDKTNKLHYGNCWCGSGTTSTSSFYQYGTSSTIIILQEFITGTVWYVHSLVNGDDDGGFWISRKYL